MSEAQYESSTAYDETAREVSWLTMMFLTVAVLGSVLFYRWSTGQAPELARTAKGFGQMLLLVWLGNSARHLLLYNSSFRENVEWLWKVMSS